jgi:hypothetical protein
VGVSLKGTVGVTKTRQHRVAHEPCVASMTSVNLSEGKTEPTGGTGDSVDAIIGKAIHPGRESRARCAEGAALETTLVVSVCSVVLGSRRE